ncbi:Substance-K receptor [Stylophora pistillata]|uniref:Substance-K receptor n=1 Tax=Stylophora pistillata TaxID=50429 RepID=A0A2B4RX71_STYPI|nr:Substance-K receptor [Stylophora pistillata]
MSANYTENMNGTQFTSSCFNTVAQRIAEIVAYCLLFVVSLVGNTLIGIAVYKTKALRKPINFLIVNMAMSDLLYPISLFPNNVVWLHTGSWLFRGLLGKALCKLVPFFVETSIVVSVQSLVLIAVDRFGAVFYPLHGPLISSKLCRFFILATWIIAMAGWCINLFAFNVVEYPEGLACKRTWNDAFGKYFLFETYIVVMNVVFRYIPFIFVAIIYVAIAAKVKSLKAPGEQRVNSRERRLKKEKSVLKMSVAIVLVFAVCWLPHTIDMKYSESLESTKDM